MTPKSAWQSLSRNPLVLPFYLPSLILSISTGALVPVLPLYAKGLDASYGLIGLVLAGQAIGMLLGDLPAGLLNRRLGQKTSMLLGVACTALSTMALFWVDSVPLAVLCRAISGFGQAVHSVSRHAYVAGAAATGIRGRAIALFGGLSRIGRFTGPMIGGVAAAACGLRAAFLVSGAATLVALLSVAAFVRVPQAGANRQEGRGTAGHNSILLTIKDHYRVLLSAGAGQLFAQTIRTGRSAIIPLYAADIVGLDVQAIGLIVSLASAVDMSLFYPAGLIMDRLGRKWAIVPSFALQALGMSLIPFTGSLVGLLLVSCLIGLGNGIGSGTMMTLGADLAPRETRGEFLGVWRLIGDGGHTVGPLIVGQVADLVALPTAAWAMAIAGLAAAAVFATFVPETLEKRERAASPT